MRNYPAKLPTIAGLPCGLDAKLSAQGYPALYSLRLETPAEPGAEYCAGLLTSCPSLFRDQASVFTLQDHYNMEISTTLCKTP